MYQFKKTDSKELERTIALLVSAIMIIMPVVFLLELSEVIYRGRASACGAVLFVGSIIVLLFDGMFLAQKENRGLRIWDIIMLFMILALTISTVFAKNVVVALSGEDLTEESFFAYLSYIIIGYSVSLISSRNNKKIIYGASVIFGLIQVVTGFFQSVIPVFDVAILEGANYRAFGTMGNSNPYGNVMVLLTCLECGLFYDSENNRERCFHGILVIIYMLSVMLSGTRGAYVGYFLASLGLSVYLLFKALKSGNAINVSKKICIIIGLVATAMVLFFITSMDSWNEVVYRTTADVKRGGFGEDRLLIWERTFKECFLKSPIFGLGPSNIWVSYTKGSILTDDLILHTTVDAHNKYLNYLCTQGVVGFVAYMTMIVYALKCVLNNYHSVDNTCYEKKYYTGLIFAWLGFTISDMFCIGMDLMVPYFYILIGIMVQRRNSQRVFGEKAMLKGKHR